MKWRTTGSRLKKRSARRSDPSEPDQALTLLVPALQGEHASVDQRALLLLLKHLDLTIETKNAPRRTHSGLSR